MKKLIFTAALLFLVFYSISIISSISLTTTQYTNQSIELNTYCINTNDSTQCGATTQCFTVLYNSSFAKQINSTLMTYASPGLFYYIDDKGLNNTLTPGNYRVTFTCSNSYGSSIKESTIELVDPSVPIGTGGGPSSGGGSSTLTFESDNVYILSDNEMEVGKSYNLDIHTTRGNNTMAEDAIELVLVVNNPNSNVNITQTSITRVDRGTYYATLNLIDLGVEPSATLNNINISVIGRGTWRAFSATKEVKLYKPSKWDLFKESLNNKLNNILVFIGDNKWYFILAVILLIVLVLGVISYIVLKRRRKE